MIKRRTENNPDRNITSFIKKHHVLTLATCVENVPWCANMFYAYDSEANVLIFSSDSKTRHIDDVMRNSFVAGSIVLETRVVGRVKGLQFQGAMRRVEEAEDHLRKLYLKRFPYAAAMSLDLWIVEPTLMKLTDNALGFGKKIIWKSDGQQEK